MCVLFLAGCGEKKPVSARMPAPPPPITAAPAPLPPRSEKSSSPAITVPPDAVPLFTETGMASWYGPPYHNRQSSNGETYDMNAMTAAHRTLPLNSVVRVTNLRSGAATVVRITDRGPFVEGRVIDLSLAAAKAIDVWRPGTAPVKLDVLDTPASLESGGRWCVQIGAFHQQIAAEELRERLSRRYLTAKVLDFPSPAGDWWVRVRVLDDDRRRAEEVTRDTHPDEGSAFLVRLD
ncbi:MAG TPA: septal ring lytic transglycosylase RlpA family protein [Terriglobales bacterium]|nr:septal ring lytic transglycosylase RlpA family protein [Terriglobales bacterium]